MSAEILRRAASLMRERALGAQEQGNTRWACSPRHDPENNGWFVHLVDAPDGYDDTIAYTPYDFEGNEVAPHIASWHPAVALAVAMWLDGEADAHSGESDCCRMEAAVAVARAYLGEDA